MSGVSLSEPIVTLSEAQAFARIESGDEEALTAGLIRTASALCEAFINQIVVARTVQADLPAGIGWTRLPFTPVRSIDNVEAVDGAGTLSLLPSTAYAIDIDSSGDGWIRVDARTTMRVRVSATVGMSASSNGVPEPIRQGVLRLVAHLFAVRDGEGGEPPAAVTALWRPFRRMRLA